MMKSKILVPVLLLVIILGSCKMPIKIHTSNTPNSGYYEEGKQTYAPLVLNASSDVIYINNSSFEENQGMHSTVPSHWMLCRYAESPPDIQSNSKKYFEVTTNASDGQNFLGMVVRDNNTVEHIAQELSAPLQKDTLYEFSLDLCLSSQLISLSKTTLRKEEFTTPAILRIWASNDICQENEDEQLLYETTVIDHYEWEKYIIQFKPESYYNYILFEAYYDEENRGAPYNGNLMLDNLSPIVKVKKDTEN